MKLPFKGAAPLIDVLGFLLGGRRGLISFFIFVFTIYLFGPTVIFTSGHRMPKRLKYMQIATIDFCPPSPVC